MSKMKFVLNRQGVKALLQSTEMQEVLQKKTQDTLNRLNGGYKADVRVGKNRATARVSTDSILSRIDNSKNNSILKAVK